MDRPSASISALPDLTSLPFNTAGSEVSTADSKEEAARLKAETEIIQQQIKQAQERDNERELELENLHREEKRLLEMKRDELCIKFIKDIEVGRPWFLEELETAEPYDPLKYLCGVSIELMENPVYHPGDTSKTNYDMESILELHTYHNGGERPPLKFPHPLTGSMVTIGEFVENRILKEEIERYKAYKGSSHAKLAAHCLEKLGKSVPRFLNLNKVGGKRRNKRKKSKRNNSKRKSHKRNSKRKSHKRNSKRKRKKR